MKNKPPSHRLSLAIWIPVLGLVGMFFAASQARGQVQLLALDEPVSDPASPPGTVLSEQAARMRSSLPLAATGDVIEVFTNTWAYSTLGLVYNPGRNSVRYAHESQSSAHNPAVYEVDLSVPHPLLGSFALSTINSGWPWQIDNRTGAGYDFVADTYFLLDYNGDLSYADDNIVEVNPAGVILNAWEMDDEVGSNDSSDGSEIDNVIDIAVVPGSPPRYFVTAAYDDAVVYEIALIKTGTWWTPNTWHTVATYTLPILTDNLGIDWDAEHEVLFHSGWHTTTILITDLGMNPITGVDTTFDCPGAGGYNSGITYIEGSDPTEVWVTDFTSDQTTRCETPFAKEVLPPAWDKSVNDLPWDPVLNVTVETSDTIKITDVITALQPFTLSETWNTSHLMLLGVAVSPNVGSMITGTGSLDLVVPAGPPEVVTVEKWFHVEPCNWTDTMLEEILLVEGGPAFDPHPVAIHKTPAELHLNSVYDQEVFVGGLASFSLEYANAGGYENAVWISNTFPITAPIAFADPFPDVIGPDGTWARWNIGDLAQGNTGVIDVYVLIDETLPPSSTITIWDGIFDHLDDLKDETFIEFHVNAQPFLVEWIKTVNGMPWEPDISVTLETSQTLLIQDILDPPLGNPDGFGLKEEWNPDQLYFISWNVSPIEYAPYVNNTTPGVWILQVPPTVDFGPVTIIKEFHVQPCNWSETVLRETAGSGLATRSRPVVVIKQQPQLWIDSFFDVSVYSGDQADFELVYGNFGGYESHAFIRNEFPSEAPFLASNPPPDELDPAGLWAAWDLGPLPCDVTGTIDVSVLVGPNMPPSTTIGITGAIFDHADVLEDETFIEYHVPPPTWEKWVNGVSWIPDMGVTVQTSDTLTVTDVISTRSAMAIVEHWNPDHLRLLEYAIDPPLGEVISNTGDLVWRFPLGAPGTITLTKILHVEPSTWTYTVLWEELWVEHIEWQRRPLHIEKFPTGQVVYLPLVLHNFSP